MGGLDTIAAIMKMLEYSARGPPLPRCAWVRPPIRELADGWRFSAMVCGVRSATIRSTITTRGLCAGSLAFKVAPRFSDLAAAVVRSGWTTSRALAVKADCRTVGTMGGLDTIAAIMKMLEYSAHGEREDACKLAGGRTECGYLLESLPLKQVVLRNARTRYRQECMGERNKQERCRERDMVQSTATCLFI